MEKLVRRHLKQALTKGAKREYYEKEYLIYTEEEAKGRRILVKPWKDCVPGDWGLSDDVYVSQCLKKRVYKGSTNLVFTFGQVFVNNNARLFYEKHKKSGDYTSVSHRTKWEQDQTKTRTKRFVETYVKMYLGGDVQWNILGRMYDPGDKNPEARAKYVIKRQHIKELVDKEIDKHLKLHNITPGPVFDLLKKAAEIAESKNDPGNITRVAEQLIDILGMKAKDQKKPEVEMNQLMGSEIEEIGSLLSEVTNDQEDPAKEVASS